jgi:hypothetical protein
MHGWLSLLVVLRDGPGAALLRHEQAWNPKLESSEASELAAGG